jgi:hypothetical protein
LENLKSRPIGFDLSYIENLPEKYNNIKNLFSNTRKENSFYGLMKDIPKIHSSSPNEQSKVYRLIRNTAVKEMKIDTSQKNWVDAFDYITKVLDKTKVDQMFRKSIQANLNIKSDNNELSRFDYFVNYYISLDSNGYYPDTALPNLVADAAHAYYGAFCDIFVTDDKKAYQKTKALYAYLNIETKVCNASDFPIQFYSINQIGYNNASESIISKIKHFIHNSFVLLNSLDDDMNPATVHRISVPLVDYFNRMQISYYKDSRALIFYKKTGNYSNIMFWSEIKSIIDKIVVEFGVDYNLKAEFKIENEKNELLEGKWQGRIWKYDEAIIEIFYNNNSYGLMLKITIQ